MVNDESSASESDEEKEDAKFNQWADMAVGSGGFDEILTRFVLCV